ncbi:RNA-binding cell elongation regulator Jag/EloR [Numidum massiliense]|uniref:RNA-binding cell elongation regulator Jag/EloR n=1 Tax=Numidum massiliense TaxID=1522315 RepID=UPI0006D57E57|nr:RNA-binding cell elongation regulator Jag/EloR [Numidum massiliense]
MNKVTASGKTVEEAIERALAQLNTVREKVEVHVIEEPSRGFLGFFGSKEAKVEVVRIADPLHDAIAFLKDVTSKMNLAIDVSAEDNDAHTVLHLRGDNIGMVIGRRGQTLDALQYLTNIVANRAHARRMRFVLDAENYRQRRLEALEKLADRLVEKVKRYRREIRLEPMNPLERKIIHTQVQKHSGVTTYSEGDEPYRRVVIAPREGK